MRNLSRKRRRTRRRKTGKTEKGRGTGTERRKAVELIQVNQSPFEALQDIPVSCDVGTKKNSQGYKETWIGYKLHIDTACNGLPLTAVLTSASLHDSQVAIPMMKLTAERVTSLYDLMDSAYDARIRSTR